MKPMSWIALLVLMGSCGAQVADPELQITLSPNTVSGPTPVVVKVTATKGDGSVGSGSVTITSTRGSLVVPEVVMLDGFGTARTEFVCDTILEPECAAAVRVVATWTVGSFTATVEAKLNAAGTTGTGGGSGGGTGTTGEYEDAGVIILSRRCPGTASVSGPTAACCYPNSGGMTAPTCGWAKLTPGASVGIPFTLEDGGSPNTLAFVKYSVPPVINTASDCSPDFGFFVQPGGLQGSISLNCYHFAVFPDLSWQLATSNGALCGEQTSSDWLGKNYFENDCLNMMSGTDTGTIRLLTRATLNNSAGHWKQSDDSVYVFPLHR